VKWISGAPGGGGGVRRLAQTKEVSVDDLIHCNTRETRDFLVKTWQHADHSAVHHLTTRGQHADHSAVHHLTTRGQHADHSAVHHLTTRGL